MLEKAKALDGAVVVAFMTAFAYMSAYLYETLYLKHFGIPRVFVDVSIRDLLTVGSFSVIFLGIFIVVALREFAIKRFPVPFIESIFTSFLLAALVTALILLADVPDWRWISRSTLSYLLPLVPFFLYVLYIAFACVRPLFKDTAASTYLEKLKATYPRVAAAATPDAGVSIFGKNVIILVLVSSLIGMGMAGGLGRLRAKSQTLFAVYQTTDATCLILHVSDDYVLCADIDVAKKKPLGHVRLLDPVGVQFRIQELGRIPRFELAEP